MASRRWVMLIHQIPAKPLYLRARFRTRLARVGAVALKNSVYAVPLEPGATRRMQSIASEIREAGGDAFVGVTRFPDSGDEARISGSHRELWSAEYRRLRDSAERLGESLGTLGGGSRSSTPALSRRLAALRARLERARSLDRPNTHDRAEVEATLDRLDRRLAAPARPAEHAADSRWKGRVWVTRQRVHVDRVACAWFVRRFLDSRARFRFVAAVDAPRRAGELGFDLPGGEFTHEDDRCSFETLLAKTGRTNPGLERIAGIVHDLDLKDGRFGFPETAGVEQLLAGIFAAHPDDPSRLERGAALFDDLYRALGRPPTLAPRGASPRAASPRIPAPRRRSRS